MKTIVQSFRSIGLLIVSGVVAGCASFPQAGSTAFFDDDLSAQQVFAQCLAAHGGDIREFPGDINLSTDGRWFAAIQRIQPIVTDAGFRVRSQERFRPRDGLYAVRHDGPLGTKQVVRSADGLSIYYNGQRETDPVKLRATAMTNDAFQMFHFGPSFFLHRGVAWSRMRDIRENGRSYRRLLVTIKPGFGEAASDEAVLWIDADTARLYRVHMTLNGFETTQGAHVDTTFLDYTQAGHYLLPNRFHERVRGPLRIDAHTWHLTGIDLDRGWTDTDITGPQFTGRAQADAATLAAGSMPTR